ncbi:hypothetical protein [Streptomyces xinghaiensis]|nr:hypothetical protein [Streptomyces xinghaiensis]PQM19525.1 hypothetical protein Sfr7A_31635 [Streptomyces xinghaiensis]
MVSTAFGLLPTSTVLAERSAPVGRARGGRALQGVPYVVWWDQELPPSLADICLRRDRPGIAYGDERPQDRCRGVLWARMSGKRGDGKAVFPALHPGRQRAAMWHLLCQVCNGPASRTPEGWLFLFEKPSGPTEDMPDGPGPDWPEGVRTRQPPVCLTCAPIARDHCPHLSGRCVAVRAQAVRRAGVNGALFQPAGFGVAQVESDLALIFGAEGIRWLLGSQLLVTLHSTTRVDLDRELARGRRR